MYLKVLGEQLASLHNRVEQLYSLINNLKNYLVQKANDKLPKILPSIQPSPDITGFKFDNFSTSGSNSLKDLEK